MPDSNPAQGNAGATNTIKALITKKKSIAFAVLFL